MDSLNKIITLTGIELKKIYSQKKYLLLLFVTAISGVIPALTGMPMPNLPYTVLSVLTMFVVPLAAMMLSADLVAGETVQNELKILLTRPVERYQIIAAKTAAAVLYGGGLLAAAGTVSAVIAAAAAGLSGIAVLSILFAYLVSLLPVLTWSAMFVLIAVISRSPSASFGTSLLVYIGSVVAGIVFSDIASLLPTSYTSIGTMVIGSQIPVASLLTGVFLLIGYGCISFCLSGLIFQKRDFL